jgi:hypothetical protein
VIISVVIIAKYCYFYLRAKDFNLSANCSEGIVYFIFQFISKYLALMASHFSIKSLFAVLSANNI